MAIGCTYKYLKADRPPAVYLLCAPTLQTDRPGGWRMARP